MIKKLRIIKKDKYNNYETIDENNKLINISIEIYDCNNELKTNDIIYISSSVLDENVLLAYGPLGSKYGKNYKNLNEKEIIKVIMSNKEYILQRWYG